MKAHTEGKIDGAKLTRPQRDILIHAVRHGAVYPRQRTGMGGSVRRMVERMAKAGLFKNEPPFEITAAGRAAISKASTP